MGISTHSLTRGMAGWAFCGALCMAGLASPAQASQLVYQSNNPSFGGSPFLDGFLLSLADIQNKHKPAGGGNNGGGVPSINFPPITIDLGGAGSVTPPTVGGTVPDGTNPAGITPSQ